MEFFIDQVDLHQKIDVAQDLLTGPLGHEVMVLAEDYGAICDFLQNLQVVRGDDDRLSRLVQLLDQADQPALRPRVKTAGGLIEQQHIRV